MKYSPLVLLFCILVVAAPGAAKNPPGSEQKTSAEKTLPQKAFTGSTPKEWADPKSAFLLAHFADLNFLQKEIEELRREVAELKKMITPDKAKK
ncbi:MAG: hypothetical protein ACYC4Q_07935 [Victivallaceae bacterium]